MLTDVFADADVILAPSAPGEAPKGLGSTGDAMFNALWTLLGVPAMKCSGEGRWGGAITAAKFLEQFVGTTPWVHLDIAGPAFTDAATDLGPAGATGVPVRALVRFLLDRAEASRR